MDIRELTCGVLVVGSGLAGLRAAYDCAAAGKNVLHISKGQFCSGASFYPLTAGLGSQLPANEADKADYLQEVLDTGAGVASEELNRILIDEITGQIERLDTLDIPTHPSSGRPACFAKKERILQGWSDWPKIRHDTGAVFSRFPNYTHMDHCTLLQIVKDGGKVCGALLADRDDQVYYVRTPVIILASGGFCGLYQYNLNAPDVCGIGQSAALDAGAALINLEFMQFIPGQTEPVPGLLFAEFSLLHCNSVTDQNGVPAMEKVLPANVTQEQCLRQRAAHGPFTSADVSCYFEEAMMDQVKRGSEKGIRLTYSDSIRTDANPYMQEAYDHFLSKGVDIVETPISLLPFAHCCNGGVWIDKDCTTGVPGLFACGEVAGGIHGADRHGGVATAACLVFGARAAKSAIAYDGGTGGAPSAQHAWDAFLAKFSGGQTGTVCADPAIRTKLARSLWLSCGVQRSEKELTALLDWIVEAEKGLRIVPGHITDSADLIHGLRTARALVQSALARRESRGGHFRTDCPAADPALDGKRFTVREADGFTVEKI